MRKLLPSIFVAIYIFYPLEHLAAQEKFAVVELFTSQGCSSCPPADKLLSVIAKQAKTHGRAIYPLSFHVDYWDKLGWYDPNSSKAASKRQYQYSKKFKTSGPYTPQMVVNGRTEFPGYDGKALKKAIKEAGGKGTVKLNASWKNYFKTLDYSITPTIDNLELYLIAFKPSHTNKVHRGENEGKTLTHTNVVKFVTKFPMPERGWGRKEIYFPESVKDSDVQILAFVQDQYTMRIHGAALLPTAEQLKAMEEEKLKEKEAEE